MRDQVRCFQVRHHLDTTSGWGHLYPSWNFCDGINKKADLQAVTLSALIRLPFMCGTARSKIMSTAAEYFTPSTVMLLLSVIRLCRILGIMLSVMKVSLRLVEKSALRSTMTLPDLHTSHTHVYDSDSLKCYTANWWICNDNNDDVMNNNNIINNNNYYYCYNSLTTTTLYLKSTIKCNNRLKYYVTWMQGFDMTSKMECWWTAAESEHIRTCVATT